MNNEELNVLKEIAKSVEALACSHKKLVSAILFFLQPIIYLILFGAFLLIFSFFSGK